MIEPFGMPNSDHPSISSMGDRPMVSVSNVRVAANGSASSTTACHVMPSTFISLLTLLRVIQS